MVKTRTASALLSVLVGLGCIVGVVWDRGGSGDAGIAGPVDVRPAVPRLDARGPTPTPEARALPAATRSRTGAEAGIDRAIATGAIGHDSALRKPNPAAYAEIGADRGPPLLKDAEAVNYLAGNTLKRQVAGQAPRYTYFAPRGIEGEGNEHAFLVSAWDRNGSDICESGPDGARLCRSLAIALDGQYEYPGAKLGTATIGGSETAVLLKGNVAKFPDHVPIFDSEAADAPQAAARSSPASAQSLWTGLVGRALVSEADGVQPGERRIVYYAPDNRVLELQPTTGGEDRPGVLRVTIGHWHLTKAAICQTASVGEAAQTCYKPEAAGDETLRLVPAGKSGKTLRISIVSDTKARDLVRN